MRAFTCWLACSQFCSQDVGDPRSGASTSLLNSNRSANFRPSGEVAEWLKAAVC